MKNKIIQIKKGLNIPISGTATTSSIINTTVKKVAILGSDYPGLKPSMQVEVGSHVDIGDVLFTDKKNAGINFTSPACGSVTAINRGAKRAFESIVISVDEIEKSKPFTEAQQYKTLGKEKISSLLQESGLWTAFKSRPFGKIPKIDSETPSAIFVNAMDTSPLAMNTSLALQSDEQKKSLNIGLEILAKLSKDNVFFCKAPELEVEIKNNDVKVVSFAGPHPAGLVGTHIHFLCPASRSRSVWHLGIQDVIAIGSFFEQGVVSVNRIISLAGPVVNNPTHINSRIGACLTEITNNQLNGDDAFIVSGSVLSGHHADKNFAFLGRYHQQVSVIENDEHRSFMGWLSPGINKFSTLGIYLSSIFKPKQFKITNSVNGSERAMVPMSTYEKVVPMDMLPTQLLRSILVGDLESAEQLGALELEEEDVSLCTFVCPGKYEYGDILRNVLNKIEEEG